MKLAVLVSNASAFRESVRLGVYFFVFQRWVHSATCISTSGAYRGCQHWGQFARLFVWILTHVFHLQIRGLVTPSYTANTGRVLVLNEWHFTLPVYSSIPQAILVRSNDLLWLIQTVSRWADRCQSANQRDHATPETRVNFVLNGNELALTDTLPYCWLTGTRKSSSSKLVRTS